MMLMKILVIMVVMKVMTGVDEKDDVKTYDEGREG